jgi:transcriptional regulator with XRE-family HTH domain
LTKRHSRHVQPAFGPEKAFGRALKALRSARKISQEQLGFETGLDRTYVSLLERGLQSPTLRTVFRLAEVLKFSPSKIVRDAEELISEHEKAKEARALESAKTRTKKAER